MSSVTDPGRSASRVAASVTARAARSASSKRGFSYQAATVSSFSVLTLPWPALWTPALTHALQPLIWLARRGTSSGPVLRAPVFIHRRYLGVAGRVLLVRLPPRRRGS